MTPGNWTELFHACFSPPPECQPAYRLARHAGGLPARPEQCGRDWQGGVLLHAGSSAFALNNKCLAAPLAWLWEK